MDEGTLINGYHGAIKYDRPFIQILYQNIKKGKQNLFVDKPEANFSLKKNKFSVLKYINEDFRIDGVYEFIIYYKEIDLVLHWNQTTSVHVSSSNTGMNKIHFDNNVSEFGGLTLNSGTESYIDGQPTGGWWYCIGCIRTHSYYGQTGMPGPWYHGYIEVNITSLWIRVKDFEMLKKLPKLAKILSCKSCQKRINICLLNWFH